MSDGNYTVDDLFIGGFRLKQPKKGYRFSLDAPLLGALVPLEHTKTVLDLGCGSGVLPLLLLGRNPALRVTGMEIRETPYALALENAKANGIDAEWILGDAMKAAELLKDRSFDLILSNPPYYPVDACRPPQNEDIAAAKTERYWDQKTMFQQAFDLLKQGGCFALIFDDRREEEMLLLAREVGFSVEKQIGFHTKADHAVSDRVYLQFRKGVACSLEQETIFIYDEHGEMTPKMKRILEIYHGTGTVPCGNAHR